MSLAARGTGVHTSTPAGSGEASATCDPSCDTVRIERRPFTLVDDTVAPVAGSRSMMRVAEPSDSVENAFDQSGTPIAAAALNTIDPEEESRARTPSAVASTMRLRALRSDGACVDAAG